MNQIVFWRNEHAGIQDMEVGSKVAATVTLFGSAASVTGGLGGVEGWLVEHYKAIGAVGVMVGMLTAIGGLITQIYFGRKRNKLLEQQSPEDQEP